MERLGVPRHDEVLERLQVGRRVGAGDGLERRHDQALVTQKTDSAEAVVEAGTRDEVDVEHEAAGEAGALCEVERDVAESVDWVQVCGGGVSGGATWRGDRDDATYPLPTQTQSRRWPRRSPGKRPR